MPKCASRQKTSKSVGVIFVICSQVIESLQQNLPRYDESASGRFVGGFNTYAYVGGNPVAFTDPSGLIIMSTLGAFQTGTTLNGAATFGAPGNSAVSAALTTTTAAAAVAAVLGTYFGGISAAIRASICIVKNGIDDGTALPPPSAPPLPTPVPPSIFRPGEFRPPVTPPMSCPIK